MMKNNNTYNRKMDQGLSELTYQKFTILKTKVNLKC